MQRKDYSFKSSDGIHDIKAFSCIPDGEVKAVLQIAHGVSEHFGRYSGLCEFLTQQGIVVCGNDHLGHGASASLEERGFFADTDGWDKVCNDVRAFSAIMRGEYPNVPYVLMGHSLGSFVCRTLFIQGGIGADGYIFSGTGDQSAMMTASGRLLARIIRRRLPNKYSWSPFIVKLAFGPYNKAVGGGRTPFDWISSDPAEVDEYIEDPNCGFPMSVSLFIDMLNGLDRIRGKKIYAAAPKNKPVLLISGKSDPVGSMGKSVVKLGKTMRAAGINARVSLHEGRHELLHEPAVRETVMAELLGFIENCRVPNTP